MKLHCYDAIQNGVHLRGFMISERGPLLHHETAIGGLPFVVRPADWSYGGVMVAHARDGRMPQQIMRKVRKHGYAISRMADPPSTFHVHDVELDCGTLRIYTVERNLDAFRDNLRRLQLSVDGERWHERRSKYLGTVLIESSLSANTLGIDSYIDLIRRGGATVQVGSVTELKVIERGVLRKVQEEMKEYGVYVQDLKIKIGEPIIEKSVLDQRDPGAQYDVALSFAGEQREFVRNVAKGLRRNGVNVFFDEFEAINLWGKDGIEFFGEIFTDASRLVVMFLSAEYIEKAWPTHERRMALSKAMAQKSEFVLPVRFDDTPAPGLPSSLQYLDARRMGAAELIDAICQKLDLVDPKPRVPGT